MSFYHIIHHYTYTYIYIYISHDSASEDLCDAAGRDRPAAGGRRAPTYFAMVLTAGTWPVDPDDGWAGCARARV